MYLINLKANGSPVALLYLVIWYLDFILSTGTSAFDRKLLFPRRACEKLSRGYLCIELAVWIFHQGVWCMAFARCFRSHFSALRTLWQRVYYVYSSSLSFAAALHVCSFFQTTSSKRFFGSIRMRITPFHIRCESGTLVTILDLVFHSHWNACVYIQLINCTSWMLNLLFALGVCALAFREQIP